MKADEGRCGWERAGDRDVVCLAWSLGSHSMPMGMTQAFCQDLKCPAEESRHHLAGTGLAGSCRAGVVPGGLGEDCMPRDRGLQRRGRPGESAASSLPWPGCAHPLSSPGLPLLLTDLQAYRPFCCCANSHAHSHPRAFVLIIPSARKALPQPSKWLAPLLHSGLCSNVSSERTP